MHHAMVVQLQATSLFGKRTPAQQSTSPEIIQSMISQVCNFSTQTKEPCLLSSLSSRTKSAQVPPLVLAHGLFEQHLWWCEAEKRTIKLKLGNPACKSSHKGATKAIKGWEEVREQQKSQSLVISEPRGPWAITSLPRADLERLFNIIYSLSVAQHARLALRDDAVK